MKVHDARFFKSVFEPGQLPGPGLPEIAFCGRSNVGKSSLINTLLRRVIAKTSATPGRTQSINFILVNQNFFFVDLPGYGYARVPERIRQDWRRLIESYLRGRAPLRSVVLIVDARREPGEDELLFVRWLERNALPWVLAVTKTDKLPMGRRRQACARWESALGACCSVPFSARTAAGADVLWKLLSRCLEPKK